MNSRLAQIIAASIRPDGTPDRAKIYHDLLITPDAPEAMLVDAFVSTEHSLQKWRTEMPAVETKLLSAVSSSLETGIRSIHAETTRLASASAAISDRVIRIAFASGLFVGLVVGALLALAGHII